MLGRGIVKMRDGQQCLTGAAAGCTIPDDKTCDDYVKCPNGECKCPTCHEVCPTG